MSFRLACPSQSPKAFFLGGGGRALRLQNPAGATISEAQPVAQELPENPAHVPLISVIFLKNTFIDSSNQRLEAAAAEAVSSCYCNHGYRV